MKIKKYITIILITIILSISLNVNAATVDSYKISLSSNNVTVKEEETVTLALKVSDIKIESGEKGIGSYEGTIEYDTSVFEEVKMKGNDNWDTPILNQGKFTSVRSDAQCTDKNQEIATITLKVKKGAKTGTTKVQIKDFEASNGLTNIANNGTEIELKIEKSQGNTGNSGNQGDNGNSGNTGNTGNSGNSGKAGGSENSGNSGNSGNNGNIGSSGNSSNSSNSNSGSNGSKNPTTTQTTNKSNASTNKQNASTNKGSLPYTGASDVIIISIFGVVALGVFCYIKYKRTY